LAFKKNIYLLLSNSSFENGFFYKIYGSLCSYYDWQVFKDIDTHFEPIPNVEIY
jgi:hypothetical protein